MKARYVLGGYAEWTVPTGIAEVVESSWTYTHMGSGQASVLALAMHRVLPHTGVSLVVRGERGPGGRFRARGLELQGAVDSYFFFRPGPVTTLVAVRLRPEWARAVLGVEASELKNRVLSVADVPGWRAAFDRLRGVYHVGEVLASLEALVHDRLCEVRADGPGITAHRVLERLRVDPSSGRLPELARAAGVSERTVRRSVTSVTGMSPKWIQRVERFNRAVTAADGMRRPRWSDLAFHYGFSDQAHLVREARALTGCTPRTLHRERRAQRPLYDGSASHA